MNCKNFFNRNSTLTLLMFATLLLLPSLALADEDLGATTCTFFNKINSVLNGLSIVVVTIAIVFAGYKVAFAHARIAEVAPVLIGGILIGAASQIANVFLKNSAATSDKCEITASLIHHATDHVAMLTQTLQHLV